VALITTVVTIVGNIAMTVTGMIGIETTVSEMNATAATIATNAIVKKGVPTDARGHALLPVVEKMIVVPGRLRLGGSSKIKDLQGTMIDGGAMMTGEVLTLIMIVAGTIAAATKRTTGSTKESSSFLFPLSLSSPCLAVFILENFLRILGLKMSLNFLTAMAKLWIAAS
jgi:hypothetical protein